MRDHCDNCKKFEHCGGSGTYQIFEQDGLQTYVCQCFCGHARKQREEVEYYLLPLIRRYGKDLLLAILNN